jgi:hypothetical protein
MTYLDEAVYCIEQKDEAAFYTIKTTEHVDPSTALEAQEYAERMYRQQNSYNGPFHAVAHNEGTEWRVMVMEE